MKKLLILIAALGAAVFLNKKLRESKLAKASWSKATDTVN
ncbi:DLW-39 family protein [Arthrobacter sp. GMC3]|nr:DLW-39 family protein [Arthrobacter sp. GMC3]